MAITVPPRSRRAPISQQRAGAVVILRPSGPLDDDLADDIREAALEAHHPVVIDLSDCAVVGREPAQRIAFAWKLFRPRMSIVCPRSSGRRLLHRAGVDSHVAVFPTVAAAVEAAPEADGWAPSRT